jgi:hypothetical protein
LTLIFPSLGLTPPITTLTLYGETIEDLVSAFSLCEPRKRKARDFVSRQARVSFDEESSCRSLCLLPLPAPSILGCHPALTLATSVEPSSRIKRGLVIFVVCKWPSPFCASLPSFDEFLGFLVIRITWEKLVIAVDTRAVLEYVAKIPITLCRRVKRIPETLLQGPLF